MSTWRVFEEDDMMYLADELRTLKEGETLTLRREGTKVVKGDAAAPALKMAGHAERVEIVRRNGRINDVRAYDSHGNSMGLPTLGMTTEDRYNDHQKVALWFWGERVAEVKEIG